MGPRLTEAPRGCANLNFGSKLTIYFKNKIIIHIFSILGAKHRIENQFVWLALFQLSQSCISPCSPMNMLSWADFDPTPELCSVEYTLEEYLIAYSAISSTGEYYAAPFHCLKAPAANHWNLFEHTLNIRSIILYFKNKNLVNPKSFYKMRNLAPSSELLSRANGHLANEDTSNRTAIFWDYSDCLNMSSIVVDYPNYPIWPVFI